MLLFWPVWELLQCRRPVDPDEYERFGTGDSGRVSNKGSKFSCCVKQSEFTAESQVVSKMFVQPKDRTGSCIHLPHSLHPFVSSWCSSLLPPSSLLFWLLHHLSPVSSDRTFHPDSLRPLFAWLGCSSQPPSVPSKSHPAGHLNGSSTTVNHPIKNKRLLDFSSSLPALPCVSAVPGET